MPLNTYLLAFNYFFIIFDIIRPLFTIAIGNASWLIVSNDSQIFFSHSSEG